MSTLKQKTFPARKSECKAPQLEQNGKNGTPSKQSSLGAGPKSTVTPKAGAERPFNKFSSMVGKQQSRLTKSSAGKYRPNTSLDPHGDRPSRTLENTLKNPCTPSAQYRHTQLLTNKGTNTRKATMVEPKYSHKMNESMDAGRGARKSKSTQHSIQYTSTLSPRNHNPILKSLLGLSVSSPVANTLISKPYLSCLKTPVNNATNSNNNKSVIVTTSNSFICNGSVSPTHDMGLDDPKTDLHDALKNKALEAEDDARMARASKMMAELQELDKNAEHSQLRAYMEEIIKADPIYGKVLQRIKLSYDDQLKTFHDQSVAAEQEAAGLKEALNDEKKKAEKLEKENIELSKEYEKQCSLIDSQKMIIRELKKQPNNSSKDNSASSMGDVGRLMDEIKALYKENSKLELLVKKLNFDLNQSKSREAALSKMSKGNSSLLSNDLNKTSVKENKKSVLGNVLTESKKGNKTEAKKSKARGKVVVPKLDFSKLPQRKQAQITVVQCDSSSGSSVEGAGNEVDVMIEPDDEGGESGTKEATDPEAESMVQARE